jgi:hypothetical protein
LNAASTLGDTETKPSVGDYTVCLSCLAVLTYRRNWTLRLLRQAEIERIDPANRTEIAEIIRRAQAIDPATRSLM